MAAEGLAAGERVTTDKDGHVLLVGVNRPEKRNAFDLAVIRQLAAAYERLGDDHDLRVGDLFGVWGEPVPKPVVMAVQGIAFTLSIELALAADVVVAAEDVRFRQLEIARGILPFGGATFRAPAQLGWGNAMRFLLTAEEFGAAQAQRIGLVQEVVPAGRQLDRALELARLVAAQAPLGVRGTLANARVARAAAERAAVAHLAELVPGILNSQDAAEGVRSFVERRPGRFTGS